MLDTRRAAACCCTVLCCAVQRCAMLCCALTCAGLCFAALCIEMSTLLKNCLACLLLRVQQNLVLRVTPRQTMWAPTWDQGGGGWGGRLRGGSGSAPCFKPALVVQPRHAATLQSPSTPRSGAASSTLCPILGRPICMTPCFDPGFTRSCLGLSQQHSAQWGVSRQGNSGGSSSKQGSAAQRYAGRS